MSKTRLGVPQQSPDDPQVFCDLTLDYAFKYCLGRPGCEENLLKIINSLLPDEHFTKLEYANPEQLSDYDSYRTGIYDLHCITNDHKHINVEMQYKPQDDFNDRMVFYSSFLIREGVTSNPDKSSYRFDPVIVIAILKDRMKGSATDNANLVNTFSITNDKTGKPLTESVRYVTVELPKVKPEPEQCKTAADRAMYVLKNMHTFREMPSGYKDFENLFKIANFANMTARERDEYWARFKEERDTASAMRTARNEGLAEGLAEGVAKGKAEGLAEGVAKGAAETRLETARKFKALGVSAEIIAQATGLSAEEIESMQ